MRQIWTLNYSLLLHDLRKLICGFCWVSYNSGTEVQERMDLISTHTAICFHQVRGNQWWFQLLLGLQCCFCLSIYPLYLVLSKCLSFMVFLTWWVQSLIPHLYNLFYGFIIFFLLLNLQITLQIFVMWLDFVTYLHHHGHEQKLPWYRGKVQIIKHENWFHPCDWNGDKHPISEQRKVCKFYGRAEKWLCIWQEWSYLRGGLTTVDRDYGIFNNIHHDIGTHVIHHLFPQIPHYHLVEAVRSHISVISDSKLQVLQSFILFWVNGNN